jgi:type II secretory pathway component PulF
VSQAPEASARRSSLAAAVVGALFHGTLWFACLFLLLFRAPVVTRTFRDYNMRLPAATEYVLDAGRFASLYWYVLVPILVVLMLVDVAVLYRLGRPTWVRVVREVWSGLSVALPAVLFVWAVLTLNMPAIKLVETLGHN